MSTAAATAGPADAPPPKGKKKLIIIVAAAALLLVLMAAVAAYFLLGKKKVHDEDEDGEARVEQQAENTKRDSKSPPAYVPLDMFVVNLADRESERYAQIGITLEMVDAKEAESIKVFMPAIRNNILMVLAHKTAAELLAKEGKQLLAGEVQRAASRALGIQVSEPGDSAAAAKSSKASKADADGDDEAPKKKKPKKPAPVLPILAVHFANFIVQ